MKMVMSAMSLKTLLPLQTINMKYSKYMLTVSLLLFGVNTFAGRGFNFDIINNSNFDMHLESDVNNGIAHWKLPAIVKAHSMHSVYAKFNWFFGGEAESTYTIKCKSDSQWDERTYIENINIYADVFDGVSISAPSRFCAKIEPHNGVIVSLDSWGFPVVQNPITITDY